MKQLEDASNELMENLIFALNHSMDLKREGIDPMVPIAIVAKGDDKTIQAFVGDTADYADQMFIKLIKEENPDIVIYANDSYITSQGVKYDAVLLKAYDKNDSEIYMVGQKFKPVTKSQEFELVGNPGFLGTIEKTTLLNNSFKPKEENSRKPWWKIW